VLSDDVVQQLREICQQIRYKKQVREDWGFGRKVARNGGTSALFSGPSGTGKTTATSIIAHELHLDLYEIDLSRVVSKYIGETEQNLRKIFEAAVNSNAILQFNEADALWGRRSEVRDAHDRYANIEIAFLLQEMERFDGVAILTTNLRQNLDEAFTRRLDFLVEFPFPDEAARRQIWQVLLPPEAPHEEIDLDVLVRLRLSGGNIKNVIYAAAFYAASEKRAINTHDLVHAVRREFQKLGRVFNEAEFGKYADAGKR
jgi:SpoVK/Ycf46/Vps4 family AAA+-type ATPase